MKAVSAVLPFRVNNYVIERLIDWSSVPDDPIYKLVFPQPGMVSPEQLSLLVDLVQKDPSEKLLFRAAREIHHRLNAHPSGQKSLNVPILDGKPLPGLQHKYRETVLFFPAAGQSCHSYCTYCFRWAQFTHSGSDRFESHQTRLLVEYLRVHPEVTDVLITGGDPMVMKADVLRAYVEPLLDPSLESLRTIRIGTKALSYWPYRFLDGEDAQATLSLFREIQGAGLSVAIMAHVSHPRELSTPAARCALKRIRATGAVVRSQSPLVRGVNDDSEVWAELWRTQLHLGVVPYYMFVARDTGAQRYFKVPLVEALDIYQRAYRSVSGLGRTARGPVMSATPGKVLVDGIARVGGEDVLALRFIQGRDPSWVGRTFFAAMNPEAVWLDDLQPAFEEGEFFFEAPFRQMVEKRKREWGRARDHRWTGISRSMTH